MLFARQRHRRFTAFTLLELLAAMALIAILSAIAIGGIRSAKQRAAITRARAELAALATALEEFKRFYGDYPQLGGLTQAPATPTGITATLPNGAGPGIETAQSKLFNCLTGVFGPRGFSNPDRLNGPNFLDVGRFTINGTLNTTFLVPVSNTPNPPAKPEQNVSLLDPWGRRYLYYYKSARSPDLWQASGFVLYSAGPVVAANGTQTPPLNPVTGLMLAPQTAEMVDNIYANQ